MVPPKQINKSRAKGQLVFSGSFFFPFPCNPSVISVLYLSKSFTNGHISFQSY